MKTAKLATRVGTLSIVAALSLASCCSSSPGTAKPWVYGISRMAYSSDGLFPDGINWSVSDPRGACAEATAIACILVAPLVIDTVLLPVTVPHDLICLR